MDVLLLQCEQLNSCVFLLYLCVCLKPCYQVKASRMAVTDNSAILHSVVCIVLSYYHKLKKEICLQGLICVCISMYFGVKRVGGGVTE